MKIVKEIEICAPLSNVYQAYADIRLWKQVLDDVVDVQVMYDDGLHQEFEMTVRRENRHETVRSIRFCFPLKSIEMFQTQPPPYFKKMAGIWSFHSHYREKTMVQAVREFESHGNSAIQSATLEKFLERNLSAFKQWIETHPFAQSR